MDHAQKILQILTDQGDLTPEMAEKVRVDAINSDTPVAEILLKNRLVDEDKLLKAKASALNVPFISLLGRGISPDILLLLPEPVAKRYKLIPFEIDKEYAQGLTTEVTEALKDASPGIRTVKAENLNQIIKEAPIAKIVSTVLDFAVKNRASDIHIEPQESRTRIRYRIDGMLAEKLALPRSVHEAVLSRIKILANMKIDEKRLPQDGRFNFKTTAEEIDLRVSTLPTVFGEKVTMRLLRKTGGIPTLQELGMSCVALKNLQTAVTKPHGIVLVTGPTGSGKTTTLYSILSRLNVINVN